MCDGSQRATMTKPAPCHLSILGFPQIGRGNEQTFTQLPGGRGERFPQLRELSWPVERQVVTPDEHQVLDRALPGRFVSQDHAALMQNCKKTIHPAGKKTSAPGITLERAS